MFLKYGYYNDTGKSSSEIINYVEKKTKHLQITNIDEDTNSIENTRDENVAEVS